MGERIGSTRSAFHFSKHGEMLMVLKLTDVPQNTTITVGHDEEQS